MPRLLRRSRNPRNTVSLFSQAKESSYRAIRAASQGASVTLVRGCDEYVATFACAVSIASVLGDRALNLGDGIPAYRIPITEMSLACAKLATKFSIALVECVCGDEGMRFVLLWKIAAVPSTEQPASLNPDDY